MIVTVTGATELLGTNLVRALLAKHHKVRALIPGDSHIIRNLGAETVKGDVRDPLSLRRTFGGAEVVYHAASITSNTSSDWPILESINITGTRNVVEACLESGVRRLVYFGSVRALVQEPLDTPVNEMRALAESEDCPPYERSKAAAEREVRKGIEEGLDAVLLNPTGMIGPYDYEPSAIAEILIALVQGKLPALIESGFDWVDARDVVEAGLRAEEVAPTGAKYLLSGQWASFHQLAKLIEANTGKSAPRVVLPAWMLPDWIARTGDSVATALNQISRQRVNLPAVPFKDIGSCNPVISHERAKAELNFHPRPLAETISDTLRWLQEAGLIDRSIEIKKL